MPAPRRSGEPTLAPEEVARVCPPARPGPPPHPHRDRRRPTSASVPDQAGDNDVAGARRGRGLGAQPVRTGRRERLLAPPADCPRPHRQAPQTLARRPVVARLAREPGAVLAPGAADRPARDAPPLAPDRLPTALAVARGGWAPPACRGRKVRAAQAARSYTWCSPPRTCRDRIGPARARASGVDVCRASVRCGRCALLYRTNSVRTARRCASLRMTM